MKRLSLYFLLLLAIPTSMQAQFTGGIGRGDHSGNGEIGLYIGGVGRGDISLAKDDVILNGDIIVVAGSNGADGYYSSLTNTLAAFQAINANDQTGKTIVITVWGNSPGESGTNSLNAGNWTSLTIYPKITGLTISGNGTGPLINLNGADNVTLDGRLNASGSAKDLTILKIQIANSAVANNIKYCDIAGNFYMTGNSSVSMDGVVTVGGNLTIENGSNLSNSPACNLTVTGKTTIKP
jgi:hypothetical protein